MAAKEGIARNATNLPNGTCVWTYGIFGTAPKPAKWYLCVDVLHFGDTSVSFAASVYYKRTLL